MDHHLTGFGAHSGTYHTRFLQLVHQTTCTVVTDGELTLDKRRGTALVAHDETGGILKERVEMLHIHILTTTIAHISLRHIGLRQLERHAVTLLIRDIFVDSFYLWCIHEGALNTLGLRAAYEC